MEQKHLKILSKGFIFKHRKRSLCQTSKFFCVMKTRVLFLMLLSGVVVSLSSCTHTEKRVVPGTENWDAPSYYILKTKDNKTLWGLQVSSFQGGQEVKNLILKCEWDGIKTYEANGGRFYLAQKGSLWYLFDASGKMLFDEKGFSDIQPVNTGLVQSGKGMYQNYITAPEGVYGAFLFGSGVTYFGPFEDYWGSAYGYFFQENGKWGYNLAKVGVIENKKGESSLLIPAQSDALIEVVDVKAITSQVRGFLAKEGKKWIALGADGKQVRTSGGNLQRMVKAYLNTPSSDGLTLKAELGEDASTFKNSSAEVGILFYHPIPW